MSNKKITAPRIPGNLNTNGPEGFFEEDLISQMSLVEYEYPYQEATQVCFEQSHFQKVNLAGSHFGRFECVDLIFENCDLSNVEWIEASFHRVQFINCKLIGTNFADSILHDCLFENCIAEYASFSYSKIKHVAFKDTPLIDAEFFETTWHSLTFENCPLTGSNWFNTKLNGLNFRTCPFDKISLSQELLAGLKINQEQAITIAGGLGLLIED